MKIAVGSDHAGFPAKERLRAFLEERGHEVADKGTHGADSTDYPTYAHAVALAVSAGKAERGILICGTGVGMGMAANRRHGVRAAVCHDEYTIEMSRMHNDANVLCLGARVLDEAAILSLAGKWLEVPFEGGRHRKRVKMIETGWGLEA